MDRPQGSAPVWGPFDHKQPLVGVDPDDLTDQWTVCFNASWLPYVLGALGALSRVEIWDTDDFSLRNQEALRGEHLLAMFMENCSLTSQTLVTTSDSGCGFKVSYDNGDTWQNFDLSGCIADIVGIGIDGAIEDGLIGPGTGNTGPVAPPAATECITRHVFLPAGRVWTLPIPVDAGDTIEVTNVTGAWWSITGLVEWSCPDGRAFVLGSCVGEQLPAFESDIFQDSHHMALMLSVGEDHFEAMIGEYTVQAGIDGVYPTFQANGDSNWLLYDGTIEFDVTVCKPAPVTGCYEYDWLHDVQGFIVNGYPGLGGVQGGWTDGEGWFTGRQYNVDFVAFIQDGVTHGLFEFTGSEYVVINSTGVDQNVSLNIYNPATGINLKNTGGTVPPGESVVDMQWASSPTDVAFWFLFYGPPGVTLRTFRMTGCTAQPTGSSACA